jgi:hypothetical protein
VVNHASYTWIQRAFLIGYFPGELMSLFVNKLVEINPNILVAETVLSPKGDELRLWNFQPSDDLIAINGKYPLSMQVYNNGEIRYHAGFTASIKRPALRDDYMENYSDSLVEELYANHYSLVEIYSRNINDELFQNIIRTLEFINSK